MWLTYGGVKIDISRTVNWRMNVQYGDDDKSYEFTRHLIEVEGLLSGFTATPYTKDADGEPEQLDFELQPRPSDDPPDPQDEEPEEDPQPARQDWTAGLSMKAIRHRLLQPRQELLLEDWAPANSDEEGEDVDEDDEDGGKIIRLLEASGLGRNKKIDVCGGPKPRYASVVRVVGSRTWFVRFGIEVCVNECPDLPDTDLGMLSCTFSEQHTIDEMFFTTRVWRGRAKFRQDVLNDLDEEDDRPDDLVQSQAWHGLADDFRFQILTAPPARFKRESINVQVNTAGDELQFEVVDKEQYLSVGDQKDSGLTKWEGFLSWNCGGSGGTGPAAFALAHAQIKLWGNPACEKENLFILATKIVKTKLQIPKKTSGEVFITSCNITEALHLPYVELSLTVRCTPPPSNADGIPFPDPDIIEMFETGVGDVFPADGTKNPAPPGDGISRAAYRGLLMANSLTDSCQQIAFSGTGLVFQDKTDPDKENILTTPQGEIDRPGEEEDGEEEPEVTIETVDDFPEEEDTDANEDERPEEGQFSEYHLDTAYYRRTHSFLIPSTAPGVKPQIVQAANETGFKVCNWTAESIGGPPQYPDPDSANDGETLVSECVIPCAPELLNNGTDYVHRVSGEYIYVFDDEPKAGGDDLERGSLPTDTSTADDNVLDGSLAVGGILES